MIIQLALHFVPKNLIFIYYALWILAEKQVFIFLNNIDVGQEK